MVPLRGNPKHMQDVGAVGRTKVGAQMFNSTSEEVETGKS